MGVRGFTYSYTIYRIRCDYCGKEVKIDTMYTSDIYSSRQAVKYIGWIRQRNNNVMCSNCSCNQEKKDLSKKTSQK